VSLQCCLFLLRDGVHRVLHSFPTRRSSDLVVFNNLIHINLLHLVSDLAGLWLLGAFLEQRLGWFKMAMLGVVCSVFGSIIQLALTDDPGLGISSALFGFYAIILVMSLKDDRFKIRFLYFYGILLLV